MHDPNAEVLHQATHALVDAARDEDLEAFTRHCDAVGQLAEHVEAAERTRALATLGAAVGESDISQGAAADLATVIQAIHTRGGAAQAAGPPLLRRLEACAAAARRFLHVWRSRTDDPPPPAERVTAEVEQLLAHTVGPMVAQELTMAWWTLGRFSSATQACLADPEVRAWLGRHPDLLSRLTQLAHALAPAREDLSELTEALYAVAPPARRAPAAPPAVPPPPAGATPDARWGPSWRSERDQRRRAEWPTRESR